MVSGIYGDIKGKPFEVSHFHLWKLCPRDMPKELWRITDEVRKILLEVTKQADKKILLETWKKHVPDHYDALTARIDESGYPFTDDTVLHIATMDAYNKCEKPCKMPDFRKAYLEWGQKYIDVGFGGVFKSWLEGKVEAPYNSFGNGSSMRIGPVAWAKQLSTEEAFHSHVITSSSVTHNNAEGIRGAKASAHASWLCLNKKGPSITMERIKQEIEEKFYYDLSRSVSDIQKDYKFEVASQLSVGESIVAFLESTDVESAINTAISLGGDADTQAMIAGCIAEAYYKKVPSYMIHTVENALPDEMLRVIEEFEKSFNVKYEII